MITRVLRSVLKNGPVSAARWGWYHLGERYFNIAVDWMVEYAVKAAKEGYRTRDRYHWAALLADQQKAK